MTTVNEKTENPERLLTTLEAAREIDRSPQQVSLLIMQGKLPAQRRGRDWLIKEADLQLILNIPKDRPAGAQHGPQRQSSTGVAGKVSTALKRGGGSGRKGKG